MADINTTVETKNQEETTPKTYTEQEVQDLLQREGDRRVSQALKKQQEAQKLANMSQEEKNNYEYNQKLNELETREKELAKKELMMETEKQLGEKGLPQAAAAFIVAIDAETTKKNITAFEKMFNKAVESAVTAKIGTGAPASSSSNNGEVTAEQFKKMTLKQQSEIFRTNPTLYAALSRK